jgi:hypothetical protein
VPDDLNPEMLKRYPELKAMVPLTRVLLTLIADEIELLEARVRAVSTQLTEYIDELAHSKYGEGRDRHYSALQALLQAAPGK